MELVLYALCVIALAILLAQVTSLPAGLSQRIPPSDSSVASTPVPKNRGLYDYDADDMFRRIGSLRDASRSQENAAAASRRLLEADGVTTSSEEAILLQQPYN